jgi:hypothetical protein
MLVFGHAAASFELRNHLIHGFATCLSAALNAGTDFDPGIVIRHFVNLLRVSHRCAFALTIVPKIELIA